MTKNDALDHLLDKYPLKTVLELKHGFIALFTTAKRSLEENSTDQSAHRKSSSRNCGQLNGEQVLECRGQIIGEDPIYLRDNHPFTQKLIFQAHLATLHGGVGLTMAKVRVKYWVPRLRRLVKKVRGTCNDCKRFQAKPYPAGPICYKSTPKTESKAYLVLYACSLTRAVNLDLPKSFLSSRVHPKPQRVHCSKRKVGNHILRQ